MGLLKSHEKELVAYLENKQKISDRHQLNLQQQSLQKAEARDEEIDHIIERLYEDNLTGKVSDERYAKLVGHYESEQKELKDQIEVLKSSVAKTEAASSGIKSFVQVAKRYLDPQVLEPDMVRELIGNIEIGEKEMVDGKQTQKIRITYRFVGELTTTDVQTL